MSSEAACSRCKAKVRAGSRFCPYCMMKLETQLDAEPERTSVVGPAPEEPPRGEGTGQQELVAAATRVLGGAPEVVVQRGEVLRGYALWTQDDQVLLLTLGFSELGRTPDVWPESGRGFELLLRIKGPTVPPWLFTALDGLLEHTFKVEVGFPVRLVPTLWCETLAVEGLERLNTVNGALRVIELKSPLGQSFSAEDREVTPPLPPDDERRRMQLRWRLEHETGVNEYSLCGETVVLDGVAERCHSRAHAAERLREALEQALRSPAQVSRFVRERPARRTLQATRTAREEEFLRARDDATSARVYRDWLLERGDPRGELAAWLEAGASEELEFFWHHDAEVLLGEWAQHLPVAQFAWACGFLDSCLLTRVRGMHDDASAQVRAILELPFLATVRGLRFECPHPSELAATWKVISLAPQAKWLTRLSLNEDGQFDAQELSWTTAGDLGPLLSALPVLEALRVRASAGRFGDLDHPRLRALTIEATELSEQRVEELAHAKAPLTSLELWTGGECGIDRIEPLFQRRGLTSFGLVNCGVTQEALPVLVRSPLFQTLEELSFARGGLIDDDVPALVAAAPALRKLRRFDLSDNALSAESLRTLRRALPNLVSESQRESSENDRYVSVAE